MLKRFQPYFVYVKPHLRVFYAAIGFAGLYAFTSGFGIAYVLQRVLPQLFEADAEPVSELTLWLLAGLIPFAFLVRGLAGFLNTYLINHVGLNVLKSLRTDLFDKLQRLQLGYFREKPTGELISRLSADATLVQQVLTVVANDIIKQPAILVCGFGYLVYASFMNQEVLFALISISLIPICVLPIRFIGKNLLKRAREQQANMGILTDVIAENLSGAREVRAFSLEEQQLGKFRSRIDSLLRSQMKVVRYNFSLAPTIEVVTSFGIALAFVSAYKRDVPLHVFVALMPVMYFCYDAIKKVGNLNNQIQQGTGALERLEEILHAPVTLNDPADAREMPRPTGALTFRNVSFQYESTPVLHDVDIDIAPGSTVAIVGPSGAGKSTFVNLLPRFYDPISGQVAIDGTPVDAVTQASLRRWISVVPQDSFLFRDSLLENIRLGRPDATREQVEQAARQAFIHDFIQSLPAGYDTLAGERGSQLSGGQRQRIAIARAFLRDAPVLILDEATSSLDSESEQQIQAALRRLVENKTVLIVAHRFSTIREVDRILLFEEGRIVADGDLPTLMKHPTFKKLYENQLV